MIKNFIPKKGDQLAFTVTYLKDTQISSMEFGVKRDYMDEDFIVYLTLGNGITKVDDRNYRISFMVDFDDGLYVYDLRTKYGNIPKTPLSGKIIVKETVFNG